MGVKGLETYINNNCPNTCKVVSIKELADEHRTHYNCHPVIVVDGMSFVHFLYFGNFEWVYGGQWKQFIHKIQEFIKRFTDIGVKLVFFFDGSVPYEKRQEWVERRITKYKNISYIFNNIRNNHTEPDDRLFELPPSMCQLARFAVKELGVKVYQTVRDADQDMAEYAAKNKSVFAIFSRDSDFVILNTKAYLDLHKLDLNRLETILYDRYCFANNYLHLNINQLPLFACLLGNDIISKDLLKEFHIRISGKYKPWIDSLVPCIVKLIQRKKWTGDLNNKKELDEISTEIWGNRSQAQLLFDGLCSYSIDFHKPPPIPPIRVSPRFQKEIYDKHISCQNQPQIFNLLYHMEYESSQTLEDQQWIPIPLIYQSIRQRYYGFFFGCYLHAASLDNIEKIKAGKNIIIKEWCAYIGNPLKEAASVSPRPLIYSQFLRNDTLPTIEELWNLFSAEERLPYFWSIFGAPLNFELLLTIPKQLIVPTCILNYLIGAGREPLMQPWEVAVFIAQALYDKDVIELKKLKVPWVDETAVYLASVFMRGVSTALTVLDICGHPFESYYAMPWKFFDGKLFHFLYVRTKERCSIVNLCNNDKSIMEKFYKLLPIVTNNTKYDVQHVDWRSYFRDFYLP